uniref:NADH-ubiquinone oxidoreductase chain 3 n=1 Tax=Vampyroteuthis infernalis TaxID=55288 RepID=A7BG33_9MOLL|nr:NADH dehydrogenase subunit 3 [Vampyroteuthis infernalis]BAF73636.1 NADH dehydrogenase subunit 3 [Vampyroteuthis infernalis]
MLSIFFYVYFLLILNMILLFIGSLISKQSHKDREKNSPFECGFDPSSNTRSPFSMRFFLLVIIFLIFDMEIILLLPLIMNIINTSSYWFMISTILFLLILLLGLYHEWNQGSLNWL